MKFPDVISDEAKDQFWAVVKECLRAFHKRQPQAALRQVGRRVKAAPEISEMLAHTKVDSAEN